MEFDIIGGKESDYLVNKNNYIDMNEIVSVNYNNTYPKNEHEYIITLKSGAVIRVRGTHLMSTYGNYIGVEIEDRDRTI